MFWVSVGEVNALEFKQALSDFLFNILISYIFTYTYMYIHTSLYIQVFIFDIQILFMRKVDLFLIFFIYPENSPPCSFYFANFLAIFFTSLLLFLLSFTNRAFSY